MRATAATLATLLALLVAGCDGASGPDDDAAGDDDAGDDDAGDDDTGDDDTGDDDTGDDDAGDDDTGDDDTGVEVTLEVVTEEHRYVPGYMFGGWGPHLGHLVRAENAQGGTDLFWSDDLCSQSTPGDCDVYVNRRVGVFRRDPKGWTQVDTVNLPSGIQQNTATLASGSTLHVYGVDTTTQRVVECEIDTITGADSCAEIPIATGSDANYVGAAVSPDGYLLAWWTNVVDGGGGTFSYIVEYTEGYNGPRTGYVGGYNDCAYAHAAFPTDGPGATLFCQVVSGWAPNWSFSTLVGEADLSTVDPVVWTNALAAAKGDPVASTNDLWIDGTTQDAHLLARTEGGSAAYYFRPDGGAWSGALHIEPSTYRARWLATQYQVALVSGPASGGLRVRALPRASITAGTPLDLAAASAVDVELPVDFGQVYAIYPVAGTYQTEPVTAIELVVVGETNQNQALFVGIVL
jgi:hypothetical protein